MKQLLKDPEANKERLAPHKVDTSDYEKKVQEEMADVYKRQDKAIGKFVEYLKTLPQYKETLIVITGDHEGLASYRAELCESPGGKGLGGGTIIGKAVE